jgi:hypothetical protein
MSNQRRGEPAIPSNYQRLLTDAQKIALKELRSFGWKLAFVRQPRFKPTEVILEHSVGKYSLLKENGELDFAATPRLRRKPLQKQVSPNDVPDPWANANDDSGFEPRVDDGPGEPPTVNGEPLPIGGGSKISKIIV